MKDLLIRPDRSVQTALKLMSDAGEKCLIVTDEDKKILGALSDGDLRKAILNGKVMGDSIDSIFNPKPTFFISGQYSIEKAREIFLRERFELIPVINEDHQVVDVLYWDKVFEDYKQPDKKKIDTSVVIMAGGRGTRLEPFTKVLPKPLVPVHDKTIIEHIIDRFTKVGIKDFHLTVNYKSRILKAFFEELQPDYSINFVEENIPLGTAGSLQFLKGVFQKPFVVTNCDILVEADYTDLYDFHIKNDYDITLVASAMSYKIPYGICELNGGGSLDQIKEKPEYNFLVNTGLYVLNPDLLDNIPTDRMYHITELIEDVKESGMKVGVYPIAEGTWIDVGQWAEYKKALDHL